jgi:deoxyribodipyrimidine photolyase-related protein
MRHLVIVLGDQLNRDASAFDGFDPAQDRVWMAEVAGESTAPLSSTARTVLFLSAMRHFAQELRDEGLAPDYATLGDSQAAGHQRLADALRAAIVRLQPAGLVMTAPGDWRVLAELRAVARESGLPLDLRDDRHFLSTVRDFAAHARGRRELRLEPWYRLLRRRHGVLMEPAGDSPKDGAQGDQPVGGAWNYDADNRASFGRTGPQDMPPPVRFEPDETTRAVMDDVRRLLPGLPGRADAFAWPVTRAQALQALDRFIRERLPGFGRHQDAMWAGEPWLWHAQLGAALNLKLLDPREVIAAAEAAWRAGQAPLASAEGFIRQILGWREYVRGIYWTRMPDYAARNALDANEPLPAFFWTGDVPMACLRDTIGQTLEHGYAHHIQRLMVTGLYSLLLGVRPQEVHAWYRAVYADAVEWVELPNTLGMALYADGGEMASKPYAASGQYIARMSNHCQGCAFRPDRRVGADACPFTTLYWDFLLRHEARFAGHPRLALQVRHLERIDAGERAAIRAQAAAIRRQGGVPGPGRA